MNSFALAAGTGASAGGTEDQVARVPWEPLRSCGERALRGNVRFLSTRSARGVSSLSRPRQLQLFPRRRSKLPTEASPWGWGAERHPQMGHGVLARKNPSSGGFADTCLWTSGGPCGFSPVRLADGAQGGGKSCAGRGSQAGRLVVTEELRAGPRN